MSGSLLLDLVFILYEVHVLKIELKNLVGARNRTRVVLYCIYYCALIID